MSVARTLAYRKEPRIRLDPRSKLFALIVVASVCLGAGFNGPDAWLRIAATLVPIVLLGSEGYLHGAIGVAVASGLALAIEYLGFNGSSGLWAIILLAYVSLIGRFLPSVALGAYVIGSTRVSEFWAALQRMHTPRLLLVPFVVVLRFVPALADELGGINDAMRLRRFDWRHPGRWVSGRLIPLCLCAVNTGDELAAAALTRGLDNPVPRTHLAKVGFSAADALLIAWCLAICVVWVLGSLS
jgi:energy-coupling factor transport system permease protein